MVTYNEVWSSSFQSAAINSTAFEDFGNDAATIRKKDRYGSANSLILTSLATEDFVIRLDGLNERIFGILYAKGSVIIKPEDGIFFSHVRLTNVSGTNSSAEEINVKIARANPIK